MKNLIKNILIIILAIIGIILLCVLGNSGTRTNDGLNEYQKRNGTIYEKINTDTFDTPTIEDDIFNSK